MSLLKFTSILDLVRHSRGTPATFKGERVSGPLWITMPEEDFLDIGSPSTITLTVEPGDLLNAPLGEASGDDELLRAAEELGIDLRPHPDSLEAQLANPDDEQFPNV